MARRGGPGDVFRVLGSACKSQLSQESWLLKLSSDWHLCVPWLPYDHLYASTIGSFYQMPCNGGYHLILNYEPQYFRLLLGILK